MLPDNLYKRVVLQNALQREPCGDQQIGGAGEESARYNEKHNFYKHTQCTSVAQEECSALPAGVFNVNEDSEDDEAYCGEQKEIATEMDEFRAAKHWINQKGWNMAAEGRATSTKRGTEIDSRLDWSGVKKSLPRVRSLT